MMQKFYIIVRQDLNPGSQIAQAIHAKDAFTHQFSEIEKKWYTESNTIVVLGVANEIELLEFNNKATELSIKCSLFYEPDINQYTALAFEPTQVTANLVKNLHLAGSVKKKKNENKRTKSFFRKMFKNSPTDGRSKSAVD